eukprot:2839419-Prymnesium_polylepis.2
MAAERLAPATSQPRALWWELDENGNRRSFAEDRAFRSRLWNTGWAAFVIVALIAGFQACRRLRDSRGCGIQAGCVVVMRATA